MADNISVTPGSGAVIAAENVGGVLIQRVKMVQGALDVDGGDISSANPMPTNVLNTPTNPVNVQQSQTYYATSTVNSSSIQLSAGASFVGGVENAFSQGNAQIMITCDQPYTLSIFQYIDAGGTQLVSTDTFTRAAGVPLNENINIPANYIKIQVTNNGASATTTFNLQTTYGNLQVAPRTNSAQGNYKVSIGDVGGVAVPAGYVPVSMPSLQTGSGSFSGTGVFNITPQNGAGTCIINLTGTWQATLQINASVDGVNYFPIDVNFEPLGIVPPGSQVTTNGQLIVNCGAYSQIQLQVVSYTSGTLSYTYSVGTGLNTLEVFSSTASSLPTASYNTDGVNGVAAIKPAGSTPLVSDPALTVTVSPNSANQNVLSLKEKDMMEVVIQELRAIRIAITHLATEGGRINANDIDPETQIMDASNIQSNIN